METVLSYLENTYLFQQKANIIDFGRDEKGSFIVVDKSNFYPQGGGQESDRGYIYSVKNTAKKVEIYFVRFNNGFVQHYYHETDNIGMSIGDGIILEVNEKRRIYCSRLHTAGHLVCNLVTETYPNLEPTKGFHFTECSYVEFNGLIDVKPDTIDNLQVQLNTSLQKDIFIKSNIVTYDELSALCKHIPVGLPQNKPLRVVQIGDFEPLCCGGTHVKNTKELQAVQIKKIKANNGVVRVSYSISND
jgi:Ser-tRNA(Ala) deacylase AlaX